MRQGLLKSKRGEETTSAPSMTMIMLPLGGILLLVTMGFIWMLVSGTANDADEVTTVTTFEITAERINEMLNSDAIFEMDDKIPLELAEGYAIVGFDGGPGSDIVKGSLDPKEKVFDTVIFKKPGICGTNACLCLFKDVKYGPLPTFGTKRYHYDDKDVVNGNKGLECFIYQEKVKFVSFDKRHPYYESNTEPVSLGFKEKQGLYPADEYIGKLLTEASKYGRNNGGYIEARYCDLVLESEFGDRWNTKGYMAHLDVFKLKDTKGNQVGNAVVFLSFKNSMTEKRRETLQAHVLPFKCRVSKGKEPAKRDCINTKTHEEKEPCSYCACGSEIKSLNQYCCKKEGENLGEIFFVSNTPCWCHETLSNKGCTRYRSEKECEDDKCRVGPPAGCSWLNNKCYATYYISYERGENPKKFYVEE